MKNTGNEKKTLTFGTVLRTFLMLLVLTNQVIAAIGKIDGFADIMWYQILSIILTVITTFITYWYNNDWTSAAKLGSKVIDALKDGKITKEEINNLLDECNKDIYSEEKKVDD